MQKANNEQIEIGKKLGIDVSTASLRVASARIEDIVYNAINPGIEKKEASDKQILFAKSLGLNVENETRLVITAMISDELEKRNIEAIRKLKLKAGDTIVLRELSQEREYVISSIAKNYRLWFKGGNGSGTWPTQIIRKTNKG